MYLSRDCRLFLDKMIKNEPDLINGYYSIENFLGKVTGYNGGYNGAVGILDSLAEDKLISYGDDKRSAFLLLERGRAYKELRRMERIDKLIAYVAGFASGIAATVITGILLSFLGI